MRVVERGILARGVADTNRACLTFPCLLALPTGELLATYRAGSTKDSADEAIELTRSSDGGRTWSAPERSFGPPQDGMKLCYLTQLADGRLLAAAMWVDHAAHPGAPLFNPVTEGCLPMTILLAYSTDTGRSWSPWRPVSMPAELGPPSLTNPIVTLVDGRLAMSIESNKSYDDPAPWRQRVVLRHSEDSGETWGPPLVAGYDPNGRIFFWDQRLARAPDGRLAAFVWTYDRAEQVYRHIHRRISADGGVTWSEAEDLGFADQPGRPAVLADGRVILPYVDRFGTRAIRARSAADIAAPFEESSDIVLYDSAAAISTGGSTGELLAEMSVWSFGLPYAEPIPGGALVAFYAGDGATLDIHWVRLEA